MKRSERHQSPPPSNLYKFFSPAIAALFVLANGACKGNDAKSGEPAADKNPAIGSGKTTPPSDNKAAVVVPKKKAPPPAAELPTDSGEHKGAHKWSVRLGGTQRDSARAVAIDAEGNIFLGGLITGTVTVPGSPEMVAESNDAVIIKLDKSGTPLWARNFGGPGSDMIESLAVDASGNVIVGGAYAEELRIGTSSLGASGSDDGFVAKFDPDGKRIWAKRMGGMASDSVQGVAVGPSGEVFVSATMQESVTLGEEQFTSEGRDDAYLIALTADGAYRWVRKLASPGYDYARRVQVDASGAIFWTAEFSQTAAFGAGGTALETVGNRDVGLIKVAADGSPVWATSFGGLGDENVFDIALDAGGDIVLTGTFKETMALGDIELKSAGEADAYIVKLASDGVPRWGKSYGTKTEDVGAAVASDKFGNVFVGGWFRSSVDFGGGPLKSNGEKDIFAVKLNRDGAHLWSKNFGGKQVDYVRAIAMSGDEPIMVGTFFLTANFGGKPLVADSTGQKLPTGEIYAAQLTR